MHLHLHLYDVMGKYHADCSFIELIDGAISYAAGFRHEGGPTTTNDELEAWLEVYHIAEVAIEQLYAEGQQDR